RDTFCKYGSNERLPSSRPLFERLMNSRAIIITRPAASDHAQNLQNPQSLFVTLYNCRAIFTCTAWLKLRTSSPDSWRNLSSRYSSVLRWRYKSEEHTSELQSRENLVCRLLLE